MHQSDIANYCIEQLKQAGAHKSQCVVTFSEKKKTCMLFQVDILQLQGVRKKKEPT